MPASCWTKSLREPVHFLWERRLGSKSRIPRYRSKTAQGLRFGKGELVYDHAIPFKYLQEVLLNLSPATSEAVATVLAKYEVIVLVTKAENARLNRAGYAHAMPENWDGADPLARYNALGIELVPNATE